MPPPIIQPPLPTEVSVDLKLQQLGQTVELTPPPIRTAEELYFWVKQNVDKKGRYVLCPSEMQHGRIEEFSQHYLTKHFDAKGGQEPVKLMLRKKRAGPTKFAKSVQEWLADRSDHLLVNEWCRRNFGHAGDLTDAPYELSIATGGGHVSREKGDVVGGNPLVSPPPPKQEEPASPRSPRSPVSPSGTKGGVRTNLVRRKYPIPKSTRTQQPEPLWKEDWPKIHHRGRELAAALNDGDVEKAYRLCAEGRMEVARHVVAETGDSSLLICARLGLPPLCSLLVEYKANVHHQNNIGETPLHVAVSRGHIRTATVLIIKHGAQDASGEALPLNKTALMMAAENSTSLPEASAHLVKVLCKEAGSVVNYQDQHGLAALHYACLAGVLEVCEVLLAFGADPRLLAEAGRSPAMLAGRHGDRGIVELLQEYGSTE